MAKLIIREGMEQPGQVVELKPGLNRFGRGAKNDHVIGNAGVSDPHCEILVDNGFIFVRDLDSTNGTFINGDAVRESALYAGQTLRLGSVEMMLDAPVVYPTLPEMTKVEPVAPAIPVTLADGYPSCLSHATRHAVWECPHCLRVYCDECIRRLRRVGGAHIKLCAACSNPCKLTAWSEMMQNKKKGFFAALVGKLTTGIKRTTRLLSPPPSNRP